MTRKGRKGRVSNELVAASCAAILAVYAAGYWRTRDEEQRLDAHSQARRPARPVPAAPAAPVAQPVELLQPASPPVPGQSMPAARKAVKAAVNPSPASVAPVSAVTSVAVEQELPALPGTEVAPAVPEPAPPPEVTWHDGTYTGWGLSRHGDIEARVTIKNGGIVAVAIATCATRYPCSVVDGILQQPVYRQSADVDRVSSATESADAYSDAVWQALKKAEAGPEAASATST